MMRGMAISSRQVREMRQTLSEYARALDGDDRFDEVLDAIEKASDALNDATNDVGSPRERDDEPTLGGRVKRREKDGQSRGDDGREKDRDTPPWRRGNDDRRDG